jgi:hypothetical protein
MTPLDPMDPMNPMNPMNDELQRALRRALKSVEPPRGFADRVLQRAAANGEPGRTEHRTQWTRWTRWTQWTQWTTSLGLAPVRWAMAATLVAATGGGLWYRAEEQRRAQGQEARRQVLLGLSIAGSKLRSVQMQVNQVNQVDQQQER